MKVKSTCLSFKISLKYLLIMKKIFLLITFLILIGWNLSYGQTSEYQYFSYSEYFKDDVIKEKKIKKITSTFFWTIPPGPLYQNDKSISSFNELGDLLCSESYYFDENDPKIIIQQTKDCFEYADGFQSRQLRFHNNRDSAEWIRDFSYELDDNQNVTKIIVKDRSYPHNSSVTEKFYNSQNKVITEKTDYGYLAEYKYDSKGNLIERIWGQEDWPRNSNLYTYDNAGKLIRYERTPQEEYETVLELNKYDKQGRIKVKESLSTENVKSQINYRYEGRNIVKLEFVNQKGETYQVTTKSFSNGLIQSEVTEMNGKVHSKVIFEYEFH